MTTGDEGQDKDNIEVKKPREKGRKNRREEGLEENEKRQKRVRILV